MRLFVRSRSGGFTLIELMVVIAIIGIIAAFAYPSYQNAVTNTRRTDAQAALAALATAMERYHTQNNTYVGATLGATGIFPNQTPLDGATKFYNLSIVGTPTASAYTVRATPISTSPQNGDGFMELDSTGARRWDKNNNGNATESGENNWTK